MISLKKSRKKPTFIFVPKLTKNVNEGCRKSKICVIIHSVKYEKNYYKIFTRR